MEASGGRAIDDMGLGKVVKVSAPIRDGAWNFPRASSHRLKEIFDLIRSYCSPLTDCEDEVMWTVSDSEDFTLRSAAHQNQAPFPASVRIDMV